MRGSEEDFLAGVEMERTGFSCCMEALMEEALITLLDAEDGYIHFSQQRQGSALVRTRAGQELTLRGEVIEDVLYELEENGQVWDMPTVSLDDDDQGMVSEENVAEETGDPAGDGVPPPTTSPAA